MEALLPADVTMRLCAVRGGPSEPSSLGYVLSARWDPTHGSRLFILYSSGVLRGWDTLTGDKADYALYIPCRGLPTTAPQTWGPEVLDDRRAAAQMTHFEVLPAVDADASVSSASAVRNTGARLLFVVARSSSVYMADLPSSAAASSPAAAAKAALLQGSHFLSGSRVYQLSGGAVPGRAAATAAWECAPGPRGLSFVVVGGDDGSLVGWAVGNDVGASALVATSTRRTAEPALARSVGRIEAEFTAVLNNASPSASAAAAASAALAGAVAAHEGGVATITPVPAFLAAALGAVAEQADGAPYSVSAAHVHPRLPARAPVAANTFFATAGKADGRIRLWRAALLPPSAYASVDAPARLAPYTVALQAIGELPTDGSCISALGAAAWPLPFATAGSAAAPARALLAAGSKDGVVSVYEVVAPSALCTWPAVALSPAAGPAVSARLVATAASRPLDPVLGLSLLRPAGGGDLRLAVGACDGSLSVYTLAGTGSKPEGGVGATGSLAPLTLLLSGFHSSCPRPAPTTTSGLLTVGAPYDGIQPTRAYQVLMSLGPQAAAQLADDVARGVTSLAGAYARAGSAASPVVGPGAAGAGFQDGPRTLQGDAFDVNVAPSVATPAALVSAALSSAVLDELRHALVVVATNDACRVRSAAAGALVAVTGGGDVMLWPNHALPSLAPPVAVQAAASVVSGSVPSPAPAPAPAPAPVHAEPEPQPATDSAATSDPTAAAAEEEHAAVMAQATATTAPVEPLPEQPELAPASEPAQPPPAADDELQPRAIPAVILRVLSGTASSNAKTAADGAGSRGGSRSSTPGRAGSKGRPRSRRGSAAPVAPAAVAAALASAASAVAAGLYNDTAPLQLGTDGGASCCGHTETPARRVAAASAARAAAAFAPVAGAAAADVPLPGGSFRNPARVAALVGSEAARATAAAIAVARSLSSPESGAVAGHAFDHPTVSGVAERALPDAAPSHHLVAPSLGSSAAILDEIRRLETAQFDEIGALRRILKARGVNDQRVVKALKARSEARRGIHPTAATEPLEPAAHATPATPAPPAEAEVEEFAYVPGGSAGGKGKGTAAARRPTTAPVAHTASSRRRAVDPVAATGPHVTGADVVSWHFSLRGSGSSSKTASHSSKAKAPAATAAGAEGSSSTVRVTRHAPPARAPAPATDATATISFVDAATYIQTH